MWAILWVFMVLVSVLLRIYNKNILILYEAKSRQNRVNNKSNQQPSRKGLFMVSL